mmetsp:Transcript_18698/g.36391  ORF Transcript_18698/g.36391 Transcript_18698/m.36391 type:complete len:208 (-) Transcript_18698:181-804(-)
MKVVRAKLKTVPTCRPHQSLRTLTLLVLGSVSMNSNDSGMRAEKGFEAEFSPPVSTAQEPVQVTPRYEVPMLMQIESKRGKHARDMPVSDERMFVVGGSQASNKGGITYVTKVYLRHPDAHIGCYNLPYSIREQLKGRRKIDENTNLDGASLIGFSIVHPERKDAKVTDGNGCLLEEVIKVYDCEGKLAAESLIIAESSTGKRKRGE